MTKQKQKYPALSKRTNPKIRQDELDCDYWHKLSDADKEYYNKFMSEWNSGDFRHEEPLNEDKKKCYDKNNARNRDIYARAKASETLDFDNETIRKSPSPEDALIEAMDVTSKPVGVRELRKRLKKRPPQ